MSNTTTENGEILYLIVREELETHLKERQEFYTEKNRKTREEGNKIKEELDEAEDKLNTVTDRMSFKGSSAYRNDSSRRDSLFESARQYARRAARFGFLLGHLDGDPFRVTAQELSALEFFD